MPLGALQNWRALFWVAYSSVLVVLGCSCLLISPVSSFSGSPIPRLYQARSSTRVNIALNSASNRRQVFKSIGAATMGAFCGVFTPDVACADDDVTLSPPPAIKKPGAPLEYLLPAARVKRTIDIAVKLVSSATTATVNNNNDTLFDKLSSMLLAPQNYLRGQGLAPIPAQPAKEYLDTYKRNREQMTILEQPGALLIQSGEIFAWKRLKQRERAQEEQDEIRAALNAYTSALNYRADEYVLNVSAKQRSQMIRQDALPDIKQVIQSDMGLRYLYRNEFLTAVQDARAELEYQMKSTENVSLEDLLQTLTKAQGACNQWFSLVDENDVREAMDVVEKESGP